MIIKAEQKFVRMSPTKLRYVANSVRRMDPDRAVQYLEQMPKRAASPIAKTLKQALANARNNLKVTDGLVVRELAVGDGPRYKRGMAVSRGQHHPIVKKTAHIRVILETLVPNKSIAGGKVSAIATKKSKIKGQKSKWRV